LPPLGKSVGDISQVTLGQLVTHTSGLPRGGGGNQVSYYLFNELLPPTGLINYWRKWNGTPGQCWLYSNIGFVTLGFAVGLVKLKNKFVNQYNEQLHLDITKPLGMTNTAAYIQPLGGPVAQGYVGPYNTTTKKWSTANDMKTTAQDMANFMAAELGVRSTGKTLKSALELTQQPVSGTPTNECGKKNKNTNFIMGMAWQISNSGQTNEVLAKDGATSVGGFSAYVALIPKLAMGITLLANKMVTGKLPSNAQSINATALSILNALQSS